VLTAGIYRVVHAGHRDCHEVVLKRGDEFPLCQRCADRVRFELLLQAEEQKPGNKNG
jgi:hypothetical protein